MRPTTNLVIPTALKLSRSDRNSGFLYIYNARYKGTPVEFFSRLWLTTMFPQFSETPGFLKLSNRQYAFIAKQYMKHGGYTRIRKVQGNDPHIELSVPLFSAQRSLSYLPYLLSQFVRASTVQETEEVTPDEVQETEDTSEPEVQVDTSQSASEEAVQTIDSIISPLRDDPSAYSNTPLRHVYSSRVVLQALRGKIGAREFDALSKSLLGIHVEATGDGFAIFGDFRIEKAQAEFLSSTPWLELRPVDIYSLVFEWANGVYGFTAKPPLFSFPISKIARTLPKMGAEEARVNEENLTIGPDGDLIYIPSHVDNTERYETEFSTFGQREDGTFAFLSLEANVDSYKVSEGGQATKKRLPANIPVLTDWLNNKFSYTNTKGLLVVQDLTRYQKANVTHLRAFLSRPVDQKILHNMLSLGGSSTDVLDIEVRDEDFFEFQGPTLELAKTRMSNANLGNALETAFGIYRSVYPQEFKDIRDIKYSMLATNSDQGLLRPLGRLLQRVFNSVVQNLDNVNEKYSVRFTCDTLGPLTAVAKYADSMADLIAADNARRNVYVSQGVDPNYQQQSLPLRSDRLGLLPHQIKVENLLRNSPDNAILPVAPGGGKTMIGLADILKEIKNNSSNPYLIMCPAHLVSQYVKEIVFATSGRMNCIAINGYSIRKNGMERLGKMIEAAPRNTVVIADYDVLRRHGERFCYGTSEVIIFPVIEFLRKFEFKYALLDECFVAGTKVDTPTGPVNIEDIRVGDIVMSAAGPQPVECVNVSTSDRLVEVRWGDNSVTCTENHPFFTKRGWVNAGNLTTDDHLVSTDTARGLVNGKNIEVRVLQDEVCQEEPSYQESEILRNLLLSEMAHESTTYQSQGSQFGSLCQDRQIGSRELCEESDSSSGIEHSYDSVKSHGECRDSEEDVEDSARNGSYVQDSGWKRDRSDRVREDSNGSATQSSMAVRGGDEDQTWDRISDELQDRPSLSAQDVGYRSGRCDALHQARENARCQEGSCVGFVRVDSVTRIECGSSGESEKGQAVYNLQVAGHPSYSVNGTLVHNCHLLKNDTARTKAAQALIMDIPKKRLASGTFLMDSPSDLAKQIGLMDPTIFGSRDEFNEKYGEIVKGGRVYAWKPNSGRQIMNDLRQNVVVAGAKRKEWAALLPWPEEEFFRVDLTPAQQAVYKALLDQTLEKIKEEASRNKKLKDALDNASDSSVDESLASLLRPFLSTLEQFITAPNRNELGARLLHGEDAISPKVAKVAERCRYHLDNKLVGKILVFTNYVVSAEEIFDNLPQDLKAQAILYRADQKLEAGSQFENDPSKTIMIGVENSMNTGLNLQHVSRLIRVETVWTPGVLEQGNSRVNRPELKKSDQREYTYYDWILANRTIDITKVSRLISKIVTNVKFDESDDPRYQTIPDVPVIPMTLENIADMNDWGESLGEYFESYQTYKQVQMADYREYREKHGALVLSPIPLAPTPEDARLMKRVPYVPGLELYNAEELGLIRVDEYLRQDHEDEVEESDDSVDDSSDENVDSEDDDFAGDTVDPRKVQLQLDNERLKDLGVHTEFGDGIILRANRKAVQVRLDTGEIVMVNRMAAFVITRTETSTKDIRDQVLKASGELPIDRPVDVPIAHARITKKSMRQAQKQMEDKQEETTPAESAISMTLAFTISNGYLGVRYASSLEDTRALRVAESFGFTKLPDYYFAHLKSHVHLHRLFTKWREAEFHMPENMAAEFKQLYDLMKSGRIANGKATYNFATKNSLKNFYREEYRPSSKTDEIRPYPLVEDGAAYVVLPMRGQQGSQRAVRIPVPGIRWLKSEPTYVFFGLNTNKVSLMIHQMLEAGVVIENIAELRAQFRKILRSPIRQSASAGPVMMF